MSSTNHRTSHSIWRILATLAWRNIWRNKKRSLILLASIIIAVVLAVLFTSMQNGQGEYMVEMTVSVFSGHIQIHHEGYWEERTLDYTMEFLPQFVDSLSRHPQIRAVTPRLETFALSAHGNTTKIASIIGIDPTLEHTVTGLQSKLSEGTYLDAASRSAMIGEGLAKILGVGVGDSIILYGQGWQGVTTAALVPICGIVRFPIPEPNSTLVYLSLPYAQELFNCPGKVTSIVILMKNSKDITTVQKSIRARVGANYEVMTWSEMMPELVQAIRSNDAGTVVMLLILYVVIGFGIFGTVMMMTLERIHEFGVLLSLGMERWRLSTVCALESLFLSLSGVTVGILLSLPVVYYFYFNPIRFTGDYAKAMLAYGFEPILPLSIGADVFGIQAACVLGTALCSSLYPVLVIRKLKPSEAIRK